MAKARIDEKTAREAVLKRAATVSVRGPHFNGDSLVLTEDPQGGAVGHSYPGPA